MHQSHMRVLERQARDLDLQDVESWPSCVSSRNSADVQENELANALDASGPHATFPTPFAQPPGPSTMNHFVPPQSSNAPSLATQQPFPQNMASLSANSMVHQQHQRPVQQPQPPTQTPAQPQGQGHSTPGHQGTPQMTPQSGPAAAREKARVSVLLDINSMLLQEVVNLQTAGKAGAAPQQPPGSHDSNPSPGSDQGSSGPDGSSSSKGKPSPEYIECMRRLQANLAYLATIADRAKKSGGVPPQAPAIMTPPPNLPSLVEVYSKLNELFPRLGKSGSGGGGVGTPPQPSPQSSHGNGKPSPSPAAESL